jgi:hypothetical protein
LKHLASPEFWSCYRRLQGPTQKLADKSFALLKSNPRHPSLHFKNIDRFWSVRVGLYHRALAVEIPEGTLWFWIGSHADYDKLIAHR